MNPLVVMYWSVRRYFGRGREARTADHVLEYLGAHQALYVHYGVGGPPAAVLIPIERVGKSWDEDGDHAHIEGSA